MILEIVISVNCTCAIYNTVVTYLNTMVCPSFNQVISGRLPRTSGPLAPQNRMVDEPSGTLVSWGVRTNQGAMPSLTESTKHRTRGQLKVHKTQNQGSAQSIKQTNQSVFFTTKYTTDARPQNHILVFITMATKGVNITKMHIIIIGICIYSWFKVRLHMN